MSTSRARVALAGVLLLSAAACGAAEPAATSAGAGTDTALAAPHHTDQPVVVIRGNDYSFDDVPEAIPAGSRLDLRNVSATELHELVAFRLPDDEARSVTELVFLPREELDAVLGAPVAVLLQAPGEPVLAAVGDGTLSEPGRYVLMCFVPVGADPAEYLAAAASGQKPDVVPGSEHFMQGMYNELVVEPT